MSSLAFLLVSLLGAPAPAPAAPTDALAAPVAAPTAAVDGWRAKEADNIAGLSDLKKLSNPAEVDYPALLDATPEIREMKEERIDPDSTKGRKLRQQAADRVTKAAELVRKEQRYCSVWKEISHSDGRAVDDITSAVKNKLDRV